MYCVIVYPSTLIRVVKNILYLLINNIALL